MTKIAILLLMAVVALFAASSASGDRLSNIVNSGAKEPLILSIGNTKIVLSMVAGTQPNCVPAGNPCGALDACCAGLTCYSAVPLVGSLIYGHCVKL